MPRTAPAAPTTPTWEFYATCPTGFEAALADELRALGLWRVRPLRGRVNFEGGRDGISAAYRACLWSRLASRVFAVLGRFTCEDADDLYEGTASLPWEDILHPDATIAVTAHGVTDELRNSHFTALRVKDAICDRLAERTGARARVDVERADAQLTVTLARGHAAIAFNLSGDPLFQRLPRAATRPGAPAHVLRPDYAALVLAQAGWSAACRAAHNGADGDRTYAAAPRTRATDPATPVLVDVSCAGGGLELEAAAQALDRAPGLTRGRWGFMGWTAHDEQAWSACVAEARARLKAARHRPFRIIATDSSREALAYARSVMQASGMGEAVTFVPADADAIARAIGERRTAVPHAVPTMLVADATEVPITHLQQVLALTAHLRTLPALAGSSLTALAHDEMLARALGRQPDVSLTVRPNNEDALLITWHGIGTAMAAGADSSAPAGNAAPAAKTPAAHAAASLASSTTTVDVGQGKPVPVLVPESEQFARRLIKNARLHRKWAQRAGVTCYRVYDADLPDYAAAIDLYQGAPSTPGRWLVIAEYAAPKTIDPALAQARFLDILALAPRILDVPAEHVHARARVRARGGSQYAGARGGTTQHGATIRNPRTGGSPARNAPNLSPLDRILPQIQEGGLTFAVNFDDYLDTGIFLDHRVTRGLVRERARRARYFLNLFAYTGTATCYAADAGVEETVTVDLSNTYLDWAEKNMRLNGFTGHAHHYVRADVLAWVDEQRRRGNRWDLIFCDPPTFSNSSKMGQRTWDVQRDHVELLRGVCDLLTDGGEAIFSCNLRSFRPNVAELAADGIALEDITAQTIPEDFARNQRIHHCYIVRRA